MKTTYIGFVSQSNLCMSGLWQTGRCCWERCPEVSSVIALVWIRSLLINGLGTCFLIEENKMGETWSRCREAAPLTRETCDQLWVIRDVARYGAKWAKCPVKRGVNVTKPVGLCLRGSGSSGSLATSPIVSFRLGDEKLDWEIILARSWHDSSSACRYEPRLS